MTSIRARSWLALALAIGMSACVSMPLSRQRLEADWAVEVLLGSEDGDVRSKVVRWRQRVHYLVVGCDRRQRQHVSSAFEQLRRTLRGVHELALSFVDAADPRIGALDFVTVFFTAPDDAQALVSQHGARPPAEGVDGWFTVFWDGQFAIHRALVFVDPELPAQWLGHTVLEEMLQVLGPCNDSALLPESVVYEAPVRSGSRTQLAEADRRLLRVLYERLQPGDDAIAIERGMVARRRIRR